MSDTASSDCQHRSLLLQVESVSKQFGGVVAVSDVSLLVATGSIHGLIGPNGAGKSTLIALITGFQRPDGGRIRLGNEDLTHKSAASIAQRGISRTFQQATPFAGLTVLENVLLGMHVRFRSTPMAIVARLPRFRREEREITDSAMRLLEAYELKAQAFADAADLTFGQSRFLEIARAVAMGPRMLLLDEPAAGLNKVEIERLARLVQQLRADGTAILLVDHDVPFVFGLSDEVTVMNFGSVIASGSASEVYGNPAVRDAYLGREQPHEART